MGLSRELEARSGGACEMCTATENVSNYTVTGGKGFPDKDIAACATCAAQMDDSSLIDENHWRCLNDSMWSEHLEVQVQAYRMLHRVKQFGWSQDLIDMLYMDEDTKAWADASGDASDEEAEKHIDANGNILQNGDNVVLIQTLNVTGANVNAAKGVVIKNVRLVEGGTHIEGRIDNQMIQVITKYLRKTK